MADCHTVPLPIGALAGGAEVMPRLGSGLINTRVSPEAGSLLFHLPVSPLLQSSRVSDAQAAVAHFRDGSRLLTEYLPECSLRS